jgi:hypothetical protein
MFSLNCLYLLLPNILSFKYINKGIITNKKIKLDNPIKSFELTVLVMVNIN